MNLKISKISSTGKFVGLQYCMQQPYQKLLFKYWQVALFWHVSLIYSEACIVKIIYPCNYLQHKLLIYNSV